jgi:hypothetical protein
MRTAYFGIWDLLDAAWHTSRLDTLTNDHHGNKGYDKEDMMGYCMQDIRLMSRHIDRDSFVRSSHEFKLHTQKLLSDQTL